MGCLLKDDKEFANWTKSLEMEKYMKRFEMVRYDWEKQRGKEKEGAE